MTSDRGLSGISMLFMLAALPACGSGGGESGGSAAAPGHTAAYVETDKTGDASFPQMSIDTNGNALAVWHQFNGSRYNIWANRYNAATNSWGTATLIETDNTGDAFDPQIAVHANGDAVAVWRQDGAADVAGVAVERYDIWANRYTDSTNTWGTAELIETNDAGNAASPQIAIDSSGNALAVWQQSDGTRDNIWSNRYTAGQGWGTAAPIETNVTGNAAFPQIAINASGNAVAVWEQSDGTRDNIWSNRYTVGLGWGTATLIEDNDVGGAGAAQIAIDANGNALALWTQYDGTRYNIMANRYDVTNHTWGTTAESIGTTDAGSADSPQITFDTTGNALAVWEKSDGTRTNIWTNRYTAATNIWGSAVPIEDNNAGPASAPQIAIHASGNALAVWEQFDGSYYSIYANRYAASTNTWGTAVLIEADDTGNAFAPQIGIDANGNALAVWYQYDGTRFNIRADRYR